MGNQLFVSPDVPPEGELEEKYVLAALRYQNAASAITGPVLLREDKLILQEKRLRKRNKEDQDLLRQLLTAWHTPDEDTVRNTVRNRGIRRFSARIRTETMAVLFQRWVDFARYSSWSRATTLGHLKARKRTAVLPAIFGRWVQHVHQAKEHRMEAGSIFTAWKLHARDQAERDLRNAAQYREDKWRRLLGMALRRWAFEARQAKRRQVAHRRRRKWSAVTLTVQVPRDRAEGDIGLQVLGGEGAPASGHEVSPMAQELMEALHSHPASQRGVVTSVSMEETEDGVGASATVAVPRFAQRRRHTVQAHQARQRHRLGNRLEQRFALADETAAASHDVEVKPWRNHFALLSDSAESDGEIKVQSTPPRTSIDSEPSADAKVTSILVGIEMGKTPREANLVTETNTKFDLDATSCDLGKAELEAANHAQSPTSTGGAMALCMDKVSPRKASMATTVESCDTTDGLLDEDPPAPPMPGFADCRYCGFCMPRIAFSANQWRKPRSSRICKSCVLLVTAPRPEAQHAEFTQSA